MTFPRIPVTSLCPFAIIIGFASGCATTPTVLLPEARAQVNQTDVRSYLPQLEVNLQYMPSAYGGGLGLVGLIVDASVNAAMSKSAEDRAKQIREQVKDFDFRSNYWHAVSNVVSEVPWVKVRGFSMVASNVAPMNETTVAEYAAMNIGADYFISPNCRVFEISTGVGFFIPRQHKKIAAANTVIYYSSEIGDAEGDKATALWMAENGAAFRRAATEGIQETAKLLRHTLEIMGGATNVMTKPAKVQAKLVHGRAGFGIPIGRIGLTGNILEETIDRVIFQAGNGPLYSFPRKEVEIEFIKGK